MALSISTRLASPACTLEFTRRTPNVLLLRIEGHDVGEFGALPMRCLDALLPVEFPAALYIDARHARGVTMHVSNDWAAWLSRHRGRFSGIHMLTGSKFVQVSAEFVRRFSELQHLMHVGSDPAAFDAALQAAAPPAADDASPRA